MTKLFEPINIGGCQLQHRLVMAPLTRFRADDDHVPMDMVRGLWENHPSTDTIPTDKA